MGSQPRPKPDHAALELLQALIEAPPAPPDPWRAPVALRSTTEQRRFALSGYMFRTWFDHVLRHTERLLALVVLIIFGIWVADGPVRDWLHEWQQSASTAIVAAAPLNPTVQPESAESESIEIARIALPYTTPAMEQPAPANEFIAPRRAPIQAPVAVAPQPTRLMATVIDLDTPVREVFVVDGIWEVADYAAGYMHGTGLPGEPGNMAMAGHAGLRGGVFRNLGALAPGDDIFVDAAGWHYRYRVRESKNVWPTDVEILAPTAKPILTLITCTNWDTQRLVVVADLIDAKPVSGS